MLKNGWLVEIGSLGLVEGRVASSWDSRYRLGQIVGVARDVGDKYL